MKKPSMGKISKAEQWYDSLKFEARMSLQEKFGHHGVSNREVKFYTWIIKNAYHEIKKLGENNRS